jgi:hypothetical protein
VGGKAAWLFASRKGHDGRLVPIASKCPSSAALGRGHIVKQGFAVLCGLRIPLEAKGMVILTECLKGGSERHVGKVLKSSEAVRKDCSDVGSNRIWNVAGLIEAR